MLSSTSSINALITAELNDNPNILPSRIIIGGFSQGAALSLLTTLTSGRKLGGAIALSGWLPLNAKIKGVCVEILLYLTASPDWTFHMKMMSDYARTLPIFLGHGTADSVVAFQYGQRSAEYLTSDCGIKKATEEDLVGVTFKSYDSMGHQSSPREVNDVAKFLQKVIPPISE